MKKRSVFRAYIVIVFLALLISEGLLWLWLVSQIGHKEELRGHIALLSVGQLLVLIVVMGVAYLFFQKKILDPIRILSSAISRVMAGHMDVKLQSSDENEIGEITEGVRFLVDRLNLTVNKLHTVSNTVSMAMSQLNNTFQNVTDGTQREVESVRGVMSSIRQAKESHEHTAESTEKLIAFSNENVTSLLEMKASADEIASSTNKLFQITEDSFSIVSEFSQTAKTIAANTEETFIAVEDTSAAVEELNASVREVEGVARESASLASQVTRLASERGMITVVDAIEGMEKISAEVQRSSEIITQLGARSSDIEKILSVIKDVTEKTNLLSLNAAILAAQAGEYGKSFSVVADEIRALSNRTASSTKDISSIIKAIQADISEAVKSIDSGKNSVNEGSAMVYKMGDALREMLMVAEKSDSMSHSIEKATEEQAKGLKQVSIAIENIRKMMDQISKATHEQQKGTAHLLESVTSVKDASDILKRGTEEEATGIRLITKNMELADERIKQIGQSTTQQQGINESIIAAVEKISTIGMTTMRGVEELSVSLATLTEEINLLNKEMESLKSAANSSMEART